MSKIYEIRAVLLDLDGTMLDTIHDLAEAANRTLAELGRPGRSVEEIHGFVGKGIPNLVRRTLTEGSAASDEEIEAALPIFRRHYAFVNGSHTRIYPGVVEGLAEMRAMGFALGCVTNKSGEFTMPLLERMGIADFFGAVISGDTLPVKKPDPAMLRHACDRLGVGVTDSLMIGASENDALAARACEMPVLLTTYGYSEGRPVDSIECDGLVSSLSEVVPRIRLRRTGR